MDAEGFTFNIMEDRSTCEIGHSILCSFFSVNHMSSREAMSSFFQFSGIGVQLFEIIGTCFIFSVTEETIRCLDYWQLIWESISFPRHIFRIFWNTD